MLKASSNMSTIEKGDIGKQSELRNDFTVLLYDKF